MADTVRYSKDGLFVLVRAADFKGHKMFGGPSAEKFDSEKGRDIKPHEWQSIVSGWQSRIQSLCGHLIQKEKGFWVPLYTPSFKADGTSIRYSKKKKTPVTERTYEWYIESAKRLTQKQNSRLGTLEEYVLFVAMLVKIEIDVYGKCVEQAWQSILTSALKRECYGDAHTEKILFHGEDEYVVVNPKGELIWCYEKKRSFEIVYNWRFVKGDRHPIKGAIPWIIVEYDGEEPELSTYEPEADAVRTIRHNDYYGMFILVEASKLHLEDEFLKHEPQTQKQKEFKTRLIEIINDKPRDFWKPQYDARVVGGDVIFSEGVSFYVYHKFDASDWYRVLENRLGPLGKRIRMGTPSEYYAFLGVLLKKLLAIGVTAKNAWYLICDDSKEIAQYKNSGYPWIFKGKTSGEIKNEACHLITHTGSRGIFDFLDLGNTRKILYAGSGYYRLAGGDRYVDGDDKPLATLIPWYCYSSCTVATGWAICEVDESFQVA